jgi:hypothetical protein
MRPQLARLLVRLYPRVWQERYGSEFENFLVESHNGPRSVANVIWSALEERLARAEGVTMNLDSNSVGALVRRPSAFLPIAMSLTALAVVLGHIAIYGIAREADEGAAAHIWQLLMAGQLPLLAFFAIKWLPRAPRQTLILLALQAGAVLASLAPVYFLHL